MGLKDLEIIKYEDRYKEQYRQLAYEWLYKYDLYEPADEEIINHPRRVVIERGGYIFLARYNEMIVGTVSLLKITEGVYELAKLAVTRQFQGIGIGSNLVNTALKTVKQNGGKKVILYTYSRLKAAAALYYKFGFKEVSFKEGKYETADIKMIKEVKT